MTCVVAYDIKENSIRDRLAGYLEKRGRRIQHSVFILEIKEGEFKNLLRDIDRITSGKGKIAVFRLCSHCRRRALQRGIEVIDLFVL